jgi:hypothetical protein
MLIILANGVLFFHSHQLDNGKIITHAHPILCSDLGDTDNHGHTEKEFFILDLLADADYFVCDFEIEIPVISIQKSAKIASFIPHEFYQEVAVGFDLRGPPSIA